MGNMVYSLYGSCRMYIINRREQAPPLLSRGYDAAVVVASGIYGLGRFKVWGTSGEAFLEDCVFRSWCVSLQTNDRMRQHRSIKWQPHSLDWVFGGGYT